MELAVNKENLKELTTKLKNKYPSLTDSDLSITNNNVANMLTMVAYKLHKSKEEMSLIIEEL
jgi:hypothetical protein